MTSQVDENKAAARAFFEMVNSRGIYAAVSTFADDATIWTVAGTKTKDDMLARGNNLDDLFEEPMRITVGTVTAEEDRVAVEARSTGKLKSGVRYANNYHFLLRMREGKIVEFREHHDTKHHGEVLG